MIRGGHVELCVRDVAKAVRFYVETLGMKLVEESAERSVLDAGSGLRLALVRGVPSETHVTFYPKLPIAEMVRIFENRGVEFENVPPRDGVHATFRDPDGNVLTLEEHALAGQ